jgi:hypothetical protein
MEYGDTKIPDFVWSKIYPEPNTGCWFWAGAVRNKKGYGSLSGIVPGKSLGVHIYMLSMKEAKPQPDLFALHSCHNPACANPNHLRWGTAWENSQDMVLAGRSHDIGLTHCKKGGHPRTPENLTKRSACKICDNESAKLRRKLAKGEQ